MPAITLAEAQAQLTSWMSASTAVAKGQSFTIGGRSLTRADAGSIQKMITFWEKKVNELTNGTPGGIKIRGATPV